MKFLTWTNTLVVAGIVAIVGGACKLDPYMVPQDYVTVTVKYDPENCRAKETQRVIRVTTINKSPKQIISVAVKLDINEPGHSTNIIDNRPPLNQDWLIKPGATNDICWWLAEIGGASEINAARQYSVESTEIRFSK